MGWEGAGFIWIVGGPLLLFGLALRFPLWFMLTVAMAVFLSWLLFRRKKKHAWLWAITSAYILLLVQWYSATQLWHL